MTTLTLSGGMTNQYLLKADDGFLLVDTGGTWAFDQFRASLQTVDVPMDAIEYVLLTHHHGDHVGFLTELHDDVTIIAHESAGPLLRVGENARTGGGLLSRRAYYAAMILSWYRPEWDLTFPPVDLRTGDVLVEDGDDLRDIGVEGTILHVPGHSPDSIALLLDDGRLFAGDAAANMGPWLGPRYHPIYIADVPAFYDSWRRILATHAERVYPGHGDPFGADRLEATLDSMSQSDLVARDPISGKYETFSDSDQ